MDDLSLKIEETVSLLKNDLNVLQNNCMRYKGAFPEDIRSGVVSFKETDNEITTQYFIFAASISKSISNIDGHLSVLPSIMVAADRQMSSRTVLFCDQLLSEYKEFYRNTGCFLEHSESIISKKNDCPSLTGLFSRLLEYERKITCFIEYLNNIEP